MRKFFSKIVFFVVSFVFIFALFSSSVSAQEGRFFDFNLWRGTGDGGEATCNVGRPCTFCDAIVIASNVINMIFGLAVVAAAVIAAVGGFYAVIEPVSSGKRKQGMDMLKNAGVGILIIIAAYPVTGFLLRTLAYGGTGESVDGSLAPWSTITCR